MRAVPVPKKGRKSRHVCDQSRHLLEQPAPRPVEQQDNHCQNQDDHQGGAQLLHDLQPFLQPVYHRAYDIGDEPADHKGHKIHQKFQADPHKEDRACQAERQADNHLPIGPVIPKLFTIACPHLLLPPSRLSADTWSPPGPRSHPVPVWSRKSKG